METRTRSDGGGESAKEQVATASEPGEAADAADVLKAPIRPESGRSKKTSRLQLLLELLLLGVAVLAIGLWQGRDLLPRASKAVPFALERFEPTGPMGQSIVSLESLRGKVVLVHFWATWCGVCRTEFGALSALERGLADDEALLAIVDDGEDLEHLTGFVQKHDLKYTILLGTPEVRRAYRVRAFPTNYIIAQDGSVAATTVGLSTRFGLKLRLFWAKWWHGTFA